MDKIWLKNYPQGVPSELGEYPYGSLGELVEKVSAKYGDKPAFNNLGTTLSFAAVDRLSANFAAFLRNELGHEVGDRVAIMMPNLLQYPVALFGVLRAGLTVVNVNPLYTAHELEHQMKDSGATTIIVAANFGHTVEVVLANTKLENVIVTELGDMCSFLKSKLVNFVVKRVKKMVPPFSIHGAIRFNDALLRGAGHSCPKVDVGLESTAFLQYTGGTTGVSKGAELTHKNMLANVQQVGTWLGPRVHPGEDIIITPLPLYHIFALTANCICFYNFGAQNILITNPRDIPGFVKELGNWRFTFITGVNTLFNALVHNDAFKKLDFSGLKIALGGGMAVQRSVAMAWHEITGVPLLEGYGLTESSPVVAINPLDLEEYSGNIGLPVPSTDISIRSELGKELPIGEAGELWVKGPQVMRGYWQRPDETANAITTDGWLKTGDIAQVDEKGFISIVDRLKDMILVSGFNVYPNEVEDAAAHCPGVLESAAIGVPDESSGEAVKLFVVKKDPELTEEQLITHCQEYLTKYKIPKIIEFRDELPKTNVGKILRRALREA